MSLRYDQQGRDTLLIVIANVMILDAIAIFLSYIQTTRPELFESNKIGKTVIFKKKTTDKERVLIVFSFFVVLIITGGVVRSSCVSNSYNTISDVYHCIFVQFTKSSKIIWSKGKSIFVSPLISIEGECYEGYFEFFGMI